jgi:hypothetical protein
MEGGKQGELDVEKLTSYRPQGTYEKDNGNVTIVFKGAQRECTIGLLVSVGLFY